ncbi:T9SS type A sorting domain-containing protein [Lacinutrix salivirga]
MINFYLNKNNTGVVIYGVQANSISKEEKKGKEKFFNIYDKLNSTSSNLEYILKFNKHESSFNLIKTLESDLSKMATSYAKNIISSDYYFNKKTNSMYRVANMYDKYTLIKTKANTYKWEITRAPSPCRTSSNTSSDKIKTKESYLINIFDIYGTLLYKTSNNSFNLEKFKSGIYIIKANINESKYTFKIIHQSS